MVAKAADGNRKAVGEALIFSEVSQCSSSSVIAPITVANSLRSLGSYAPENKCIYRTTVLPCLTAIIGTFGLVLE